MSGTRTAASSALFVLVVMTVSACTGSAGHSSGGSAASARAQFAATPAPAGRASPLERTNRDVATSRLTGATSTSLIVTADLALTVTTGTTLDRAATRAGQIATSAGGRVDADDRTSPRSRRVEPRAALTLRVPDGQVAPVLDRLAELGTETSRRSSTEDVTEQVADVASRVTSARRSIASLDRLYGHAAKVGDIIDIEAALSTREASLESLEARQRSLAAQTALATINVTLTGRRAAPTAVRRQHESSGFVGGLRHGWHAFASTAGALATAVGAVLPFVVVLLVVGLGVLAFRRVRRSTG